MSKSDDQTKKLQAVQEKFFSKWRSFIIKSALEQYLDEYADYQIALDRLKDKQDKIITSEDLRKELGI